jgi:hypothetical protein
MRNDEGVTRQVTTIIYVTRCGVEGRYFWRGILHFIAGCSVSSLLYIILFVYQCAVCDGIQLRTRRENAVFTCFVDAFVCCVA